MKTKLVAINSADMVMGTIMIALFVFGRTGTAVFPALLVVVVDRVRLLPAVPLPPVVPPPLTVGVVLPLSDFVLGVGVLGVGVLGLGAVGVGVLGLGGVGVEIPGGPGVGGVEIPGGLGVGGSEGGEDAS